MRPRPRALDTGVLQPGTDLSASLDSVSSVLERRGCRCPPIPICLAGPCGWCEGGHRNPASQGPVGAQVHFHVLSPGHTLSPLVLPEPLVMGALTVPTHRPGTEGQSTSVSCPRSPSRSAAGPGFAPGVSESRVLLNSNLSSLPPPPWLTVPMAENMEPFAYEIKNVLSFLGSAILPSSFLLDGIPSASRGCA